MKALTEYQYACLRDCGPPYDWDSPPMSEGENNFCQNLIERGLMALVEQRRLRDDGTEEVAHFYNITSLGSLALRCHQALRQAG